MRLLSAVLVLFGGLSFPHAASAGETVTYTYDAKGRLARVARSGSANNGVVTQYVYDKAGNRKRVVTTGSPNAPQ